MKNFAEHHVIMEQFVEDNSRITLKELQQQFQENNQTLVSTECLRKYLH